MGDGVRGRAVGQSFLARFLHHQTSGTTGSGRKRAAKPLESNGLVMRSEQSSSSRLQCGRDHNSASDTQTRSVASATLEATPAHRLGLMERDHRAVDDDDGTPA